LNCVCPKCPGQLTTCMSITSSYATFQLNGGNGFCNVGSRVNPGEFFQGAISAVYMFNRVLTNAEISNIYTNTLRWF
jgi:hypothetical protein